MRRGVRTARWKFIRSAPSPLIDVRDPDATPASLRDVAASEELYDLLRDPGEMDNRISADPATAAMLRTPSNATPRSTCRRNTTRG